MAISHLARKTTKRLGELLVEAGLLSKEQLDMALAQQRQEGGMLGEILVKRGFVTEADVAKAIAAQYNVPYIEATSYDVNPEVVDLFPIDFMRKNNFAPLDKFRDVLLLVLSSPLSSVTFGQVEKQSGCQLQCLVTSSSSLRELHDKIEEMQKQLAKRKEAAPAKEEKEKEAVAETAVTTSDDEWASLLETVKDADFLKELQQSLNELEINPQAKNEDEEG